MSFPTASARSAAAGTTVAGLLVVGGAASAAVAGVPLTHVYPALAALTFAAVMLIAIAGIADHHPYPRFGPANAVTTMRAVLVALIVALIGEAPLVPVAALATGLSLVVAALDGVDGWLARRTGLASRFGARFDMEVDALGIAALAVLVWRHERAGAWVLVAGGLRYAFVAAGWIFAWMQRPLPPSRRRQTICVVQLLGLTAALAPIVPDDLGAPIAAMTVAFLCYSFFVDTRWLWLQARPAIAAAADAEPVPYAGT